MKSAGELALATQQLIKRLLAMSDDEVLTYATIRDELGVDVQDDAQGYLRTARKHAEKAATRIFATIRGVGIKRLLPGASGGEFTDARKRVSRAARRAFRRSANVDFAQLTPEQRTQLNLERTLLNFAAEGTSAKAERRLAGVVTLKEDPLSDKRVLELFAS